MSKYYLFVVISLGSFCVVFGEISLLFVVLGCHLTFTNRGM